MIRIKSKTTFLPKGNNKKPILLNREPLEEQTRRERPKSAPYLRLKNIQGTTIGKIWKKNFFQKNYF